MSLLLSCSNRNGIELVIAIKDLQSVTSALSACRYRAVYMCGFTLTRMLIGYKRSIRAIVLH